MLTRRLIALGMVAFIATGCANGSDDSATAASESVAGATAASEPAEPTPADLTKLAAATRQLVYTT